MPALRYDWSLVLVENELLSASRGGTSLANRSTSRRGLSENGWERKITRGAVSQSGRAGGAETWSSSAPELEMAVNRDASLLRSEADLGEMFVGMSRA